MMSFFPRRWRSLIDSITRTRPPHYPSTRHWLVAGIRRQPWASLAALASGWTLLWFALWAALVTAVLGALTAFGISTHFLGNAFGAGQAVGILSALGGLITGALAGFTLIYGATIAMAPLRILVSLASGAIFATIVTLVVIAGEPISLRFRGYRRLSRRERERVEPLIAEAAQRMGLTQVPPVLVSDTLLPNAWAHLRAIVITKGSLELLDPGELAGVLAHELHHWSAGDVVAQRFVWACSWPIALMVNVGYRMTKRGSFLSTIAFLVFWPAHVLVRLLIVPVTAARGREQEYQADAAAAAAGYGAGLSSALEKISELDGGRTGWEEALQRTHPPTELRLEALEDAPEYNARSVSSPEPAQPVTTSASALWTPVKENPVSHSG